MVVECKTQFRGLGGFSVVVRILTPGQPGPQPRYIVPHNEHIKQINLGRNSDLLNKSPLL